LSEEKQRHRGGEGHEQGHEVDLSHFFRILEAHLQKVAFGAKRPFLLLKKKLFFTSK
jgi:hypothetical protein